MRRWYKHHVSNIPVIQGGLVLKSCLHDHIKYIRKCLHRREGMAPLRALLLDYFYLFIFCEIKKGPLFCRYNVTFTSVSFELNHSVNHDNVQQKPYNVNKCNGKLSKTNSPEK